MSSKNKNFGQEVAMLGTQAREDLVHLLYIIYYGRPADPGGLKHWLSLLPQGNELTSGSLRSFISTFINSVESRERFGIVPMENTVKRLITYAYSRDATASEISTLKNLSVEDLILKLLQPENPTDRKTLENKLKYAKIFTTILDPNGDGIPNDHPTCRDFLLTYRGNTDAENMASRLVTIRHDSVIDPERVFQDIKKALEKPFDCIRHITCLDALNNFVSGVSDKVFSIVYYSNLPDLTPVIGKIPTPSPSPAPAPTPITPQPYPIDYFDLIDYIDDAFDFCFDFSDHDMVITQAELNKFNLYDPSDQVIFIIVDNPDNITSSYVRSLFGTVNTPFSLNAMDNSVTTLVFINPTLTRGRMYRVVDESFSPRKIDLAVYYDGTLVINEEIYRKAEQLKRLLEKYENVDKKEPFDDSLLVSDPLNLSSFYLINYLNSKYPGELENNFVWVYAESNDGYSLYLVWDNDPAAGRAQFQTMKLYDFIRIPPDLMFA